MHALLQIHMSPYLERVLFVKEKRSWFVTSQLTLCKKKQKALESSETLVTTERSAIV